MLKFVVLLLDETTCNISQSRRLFRWAALVGWLELRLRLDIGGLRGGAQGLQGLLCRCRSAGNCLAGDTEHP